MSAFYDVAPISPDRNVWGDPFMMTEFKPCESLSRRFAVTTELAAPNIRVCGISPVVLVCTGERCVSHCSAILQKRVHPNGDEDGEGGAE